MSSERKTSSPPPAPSREKGSSRRGTEHPQPGPGKKVRSSSAAWIPLLIGIVFVWPWLASMTCGITGVCLSPGSHRQDGWLSTHKIGSSGWRLTFGLMAIAGGINGLAANRRR